MRLFVALDIDAEIRERIADFRDQMRALAPDVRWVGPETFHVTLQFLGETKKLDEIQTRAAAGEGSPIHLAFRDAGFFPTPKSPRVFWVGIEVGRALAGTRELDSGCASATRLRARRRAVQAAS